MTDVDSSPTENIAVARSVSGVKRNRAENLNMERINGIKMFYQTSLFYPEGLQKKSLISPFVYEGKVNIPSDNWLMLKHNYTQDEIIKSFIDEIISGNIKLPLREISYDEMVRSFNELVRYKCNDYQYGKIYSRYEYNYDISNQYISETNVGNLASDYFHQENRFKAGSINSPSPVRTWGNAKFLNGALKALFTLKPDQINSSTLRTCLSLRKYIASQFKPSIAKSVYEKFNSQYVLDFSAGWGDRLCGFYATDNTKYYIGIDPNTSLVGGYVSQIKTYSTLTSGKNATMICLPAEDAKLEKESVDTVFTSPPYFNVERYSNEETQSFKRYKGIENWLNGFMFKAIDNAWNALQRGGHMVINISDVYAGHRINKICDPMNDYIAKLNSEYIGCIGMQMSKRPNSKASGHDGEIFIEPMWVWKKT